MLETPKAADATEAKNPLDVTMGNQQASGIVAGLYMGEGNFSFNKSNEKRGGINISTSVGFSNTDPALIDFVCSWLEAHALSHFICTAGAAQSTVYQIRVGRHSHIVHLVDLLEPFMFGKKLHEARLLRRFCQKRSLVGAGKGAKQGNERRRYDEEDLRLCADKRQLSESSETIRSSHCWNEHRSVQPVKI